MSEIYEFNTLEEDQAMDFFFSRVSTFYKASGKWEAKTCEFKIFKIDDNEKRTQVAFVNDFDMSKFCDKTEQQHRIDFRNSEFASTFITLVWSVTEASSIISKDAQQRMARQSVANVNAGLDPGMQLAPAQIRKLIEDNNNLKQQV